MLNITTNTIAHKVDIDKLKAFKEVRQTRAARMAAYFVLGIFTFMFCILFLPWTQAVQTRGQVTTLKPEHRAQTVHATIAGRIEKWFVSEGMFVKRGDTIANISEVKESYMDPSLIARTKEQVDAKKQSIGAYEDKVSALSQQYSLLEQALTLKLSQTQNKVSQARFKVTSDSMALLTERNNFDIAKKQYERQEALYKQGIKSLTDLEGRNMKFREAENKLVSAENKLLGSQNDLSNALIELNNVRNEYGEKLAKARSDRMSALSDKFTTEAEVAKLENQLSNYRLRAGYYYITAPQDGYITKAIKTGIGEIIKEGDPLLSFIPADYELAVELFVDPLDLPLMATGQTIRLQFDGWPVLVFRGWPDFYFGTFSGKVVAIDRMTSSNNKYRLLVAPDKDHEPWPVQVQIGSGVYGLALLNQVPVWYELWRQLNGFPPDFYTHGKVEGGDSKKK